MRGEEQAPCTVRSVYLRVNRLEKNPCMSYSRGRMTSGPFRGRLLGVRRHESRIHDLSKHFKETISSVYSPVLTNVPLYMSVIANNLTNELKVIHQFDQELHVYSLTT